MSIMAAAIVSILYSYLFYKKKMAAGEKLKIQYNKKTIVIYVIVSVFVVIFTIWTLFWGGIDISFHDNDFTVEAQGWSDYTVDYEQIDSISYKENLFQNGNDRRTNGMGNLKYGMGNFRNDIYGDYIRYTHASCHSYVLVKRAAADAYHPGCLAHGSRLAHLEHPAGLRHLYEYLRQGFCRYDVIFLIAHGRNLR